MRARVPISLLLMRLLLPALALQNIPEHQFPLQPPTPNSSPACLALHHTFPFQTLFPTDSIYTTAQSSYWAAQQASLHPACRFLAYNAYDVSQALQILVAHSTAFAVVSGGHSSNNNASNIQDGVTIDLSRINDVVVTDHGEAAWLGVGARWRDVNSVEMQMKGLVVSGGRVAGVGVGGYVLGGGFSWFANQYGWTCDSVLEFEVVTPDAEVRIVNATHHAELFWALKGSLGAFGIVTRIKVPTIRNTGVYGGSVSYHDERLEAVFAALESMSHVPPEDPHTQGYLSFGWMGNGDDRDKMHMNAVYLVNTDGIATGPSIDSLKRIAYVHSTLRHTSIHDSAEELDAGNSPGLRRRKFTLTVYPGHERAGMRTVHRLCSRATASLSLQPNETSGVTIQPLTVPMMQRGHSSSGEANSNIFNLDPAAGPLLLVSVETWWADANRDEMFEAHMDELYVSLLEELGGKGLVHEGFVYPNYAWEKQEPFAELEECVKERLRAVRKRYDSEGVFGRLRRGVWSLTDL